MSEYGEWWTASGVAALLALAALVAGLVAALAWRLAPRGRNEQRLRERFGPEFELAAARYGPRRALRVLLARERRVERLPLRSLPPSERASLFQSWSQLQQQFVDDPRRAEQSAHDLVLRTLRARGYPVEDHEQCLEDLSVDYAGILQHFRAAHAIDEANRAGRADTEALRQALVSYRVIFEGLLGTPREQIPPASQRYAPVLEHHPAPPR